MPVKRPRKPSAGSPKNTHGCGGVTMATTTNEAGAIGPVPFMNDGRATFEVRWGLAGNDPKQFVRLYQGTWVLATFVPAIASIQESFRPRAGDVFIASIPKSGTTWLKALAFATMARGVYPPDAVDHPLLRLNPHQCVADLERLFSAGQESRMEAMPSPRLVSMHMHHSLLPSSISKNPDCKIVYICRDPKDMLVSSWHFGKRGKPDMSFSDLFEAFCQGASVSGPFWDHVLGYWNASKANPEAVLFLRYEDMLRDPAGNVRKLARFVGQPFSPAEEEAGVVEQVVRLCSFDNLKNLDVNKPSLPARPLANDWFFRKGEAGDWVNHMTPEMARRLDTIVEEKLSGSGLSFA